MSNILAFLHRLFPQNRVARSIYLLAGSTAMAHLIVISAMPLVTRLYTPAQIGIASLFLSFFGFWSSTLSLRYEYALLIAANDEESHIVHRLASFLVIVMSLLGIPVLWMLQYFNVLEFELLPAWVPLFAFPVLVGQGLFMVYRSWALRGGLVQYITQASIARAAANAGTKLGLGFFGGSIIGLLAAELAGACVSMLKLMRATQQHFAESMPKHIGFSQMVLTGKKFRKFPLLETPSAWMDSLALALPLPLVASLYGAEAAGWFGVARMVVSVPNAQIGSAVADVFQMELAKAVLEDDGQRARSLFYSLLKKMALLGLIPLLGVTLVLPWMFPYIFGQQWEQAGAIGAALAPWLYAAFIISPLSRALSVLQAQEWKLVYDISAVSLMLGCFYIAKNLNLDLIEFCLFLSVAKMIGYAIYAVVLVKLIDRSFQKDKAAGRG